MGTGPVPCHLLLSPLPTPRHRPKSVTSCFFLFPQLFFPTHPGKSIARPRRARTHNHHHTGPGTWICIWPGPDLVLHVFCTATAHPYFLSVQEVVSSLPRRSTNTLSSTFLPAHQEVCETGCTRQGLRRKEERQPDNIPLHRVNNHTSQPGRRIYPVYRLSSFIQPGIHFS